NRTDTAKQGKISRRKTNPGGENIRAKAWILKKLKKKNFHPSHNHQKSRDAVKCRDMDQR
ncbi:hypothetical protein V7S82_24270, partial [Enterobacter hormaechei subsp. steigerwaltii]|uniref:hypothetical protein n=1 Tax=Enterobacter hormaechei TaxID=158836 RepID=UPI003204BCD4